MSMNSGLTIYHGSTKIVDNPKFGHGYPHNDFGPGFYCTEHLEIAKEWACKDRIDGYLNVYNLDLSDLKVLHLNKEYDVLNWLAVLLENRPVTMTGDVSEESSRYLKENYAVDIEDYDIIVGYRVDDRYFNFVRRFLNNTIGIKILTESMSLGTLGEQIVLKSKKSFEQISFVEAIEVDASVYYPKYSKRMDIANKKFEYTTHGRFLTDDVFIVDLIRETRK